ncbi:hypothetical protein CIHG_04794 [Coccidioides immitis H538.4]|uniref:Uncharacterized protein n=1 Tax=Coccidioides immitis H538.4 TaxID=396776 RepID=A0A0J8UIP0_COCIT|nr:hypothetical protein CIHG_04794 [Coccidioides immitis H538.4]
MEFDLQRGLCLLEAAKESSSSSLFKEELSESSSIIASSLFFLSVTVSLLPAQAIIVAVSSAPAEFINAIFYLILEHKLYLPVKEHDILAVCIQLYKSILMTQAGVQLSPEQKCSICKRAQQDYSNILFTECIFTDLN